MSYTVGEITRLRGSYVVRNVSGGDVPLSVAWGGHVLAAGEEADLCDPDGALTAGSYAAARMVCGRAGVNTPPVYVSTELSKLIADGSLIVVVDTPPDLSILMG